MVEFHEKLQELRKDRGLTQDDLAETLHVSRSAVSKWESGRGYPSIESLKDISKYFSVSIDDLLSGEKLLCLAENENKSNIKAMGNMLFGMVDICSLILIFLPLYPSVAEEVVHAVNLLEYTEIMWVNRLIYWTMYVALIAVGALKLLMTKLKFEKSNTVTSEISMALSIVLVMFLAITRETYAIVVAFILLVIKGMLFIRYK